MVFSVSAMSEYIAPAKAGSRNGSARHQCLAMVSRILRFISIYLIVSLFYLALYILFGICTVAILYRIQSPAI
jgi:hypothetical protein